MRVKRLRTNTQAHASEGTRSRKKKTEVTARENRPTREGEGPEPQAETKSEVPEGPEGPKVANKPEFAERCVSRFPG